MNWDAVGAIGEIIGALAVVATLVYLAMQIRHSSNQSAVNTASIILNEFNRMQEALFSNPQTSDLLAKLKLGGELTEGESVQIESIANRYITHWFQIQMSHDRGLVDTAVYKTMCEDVERILEQYPPIKEIFSDILSFYSIAESVPIFAPIYRENAERRKENK